jgi:hypothetical protein
MQHEIRMCVLRVLRFLDVLIEDQAYIGRRKLFPLPTDVNARLLRS